MPISDMPGYEAEHFGRVYSHLIKPACEAAGFSPVRADDVKSTNYIVIDILKRIISCDIVICDLSSRNPNVMYELGIRQAFNLPSVLIKDNITDRVFDIQGIRTVDYNEKLRVDLVEKDIQKIKVAIEKTISENGKDINSLIQLLGVPPAEISNSSKVSNETSLLLEQLKDISQRITRIEDNIITSRQINPPNVPVLRRRSKFTLPNGESITLGDTLYSKPGGKELGYFQGRNDKGFVVSKTVSGQDPTVIPIDSEIYETLSTSPF